MPFAKPIPVADGGEAGAHGGETGVNGLNGRRVVAERLAAAATGGRRGAHLNGGKKFHISMRYNRRPIMPKNDHRKNVPQNHVYNDTRGERKYGFDTRAGELPETSRKPDT